MIRIEPAESVHWRDGNKHYVGKAMRCQHGGRIPHEACDMYLVRLDYDGGTVFVEDAKLRAYPDSAIPEPVNQGVVR